MQSPGRAATEPLETGSFAQRLQRALNSGSDQDLEAAVDSELLPSLGRRYQSFRADFPGLSWAVKPDEPLADGRSTLLVTVNGATSSQGFIYD